VALNTATEPARPADYLPPESRAPRSPAREASGETPSASSDLGKISEYIAGRGFTFEPWQIAAFVTAARTKPFIILAGVSGTGKSALPKLVADATGAVTTVVPVRPDWHDSSDLLGYEHLNGEFRPGHLLRFAAEAARNPDTQYFFLLDEMNIARVEYYLAEVLSKIEELGALRPGELASPLHPSAPSSSDDWASVALPANLCIVGSVNMDETTFGFSRKVLDRAFVIEFSEVDLEIVEIVDEVSAQPLSWTPKEWARDSATLAAHPRRADPVVGDVISTLTELNGMLQQAQLQFGYRMRDEVAMFCLAAQQALESFETSEGGQIDPIDLSISMKVLPRIQGSGPGIVTLLEELALWAQPSGDAAQGARAYPICALRINLMRRRLSETGFTNYWL
jgi:5-methylcytosine-specific restriction endonuclease McrBC GTP-binding regulatory subunit McrB